MNQTMISQQKTILMQKVDFFFILILNEHRAIVKKEK